MEVLDIDKVLDEYSDLVYRIAYTQMNQRADAEDIYQDVFIKLMKNYKKIENKKHLKYWLIRVTINCCRSQQTSAWKIRTVSFDDSLLTSEKAVTKDEDLENVLEACRSLSKDNQLIIHLFYIEGYSLKEISEIMDITLSTAKVRLSRSRKKLKKMLGVEF